MTAGTRRAIFGAGCYWGAEAAFRRVPGVVDASVGFMADSLCGRGVAGSDDDAHVRRQVEVVVVDYSPDSVTYQDLLDVFWGCHDPTRSPYDGEGKPDMERSVLFVADSGQKSSADAAVAAVAASGRFDAPVTTAVAAAGHFHRAAEDQQRYLEKNEGVVCSLKHHPATAAE